MTGFCLNLNYLNSYHWKKKKNHTAIKLIQILVRKRGSCTADLECFQKRTSANRGTCLKASLVDTLSREAFVIPVWTLWEKKEQTFWPAFMSLLIDFVRNYFVWISPKLKYKYAIHQNLECETIQTAAVCYELCDDWKTRVLASSLSDMKPFWKASVKK